MPNSTDVRKLTNEAKQLYAALNEAESAVESAIESDIEVAWQFGQRLNSLKRAIPHGNWEQFREDAFPDLDDRKAHRCQALDTQNPKASSWTDLSDESIRQYRHVYVPDKKRNKLKGDKKFARPSHHSSVVNECNKLKQRIEAKQYKPSMAQLRRDFREFYAWLYRDVYGGRPPQ